MASPQDEAMARTENLLRDAEEALQQERLAEFWRQWGTTIIGMALMLVVGTGAGVAWRSWKQSHNEASTTKLLALVSQADPIIGPETAKDLGSNQAAIAYITKAGAIAAKGNTEASREELNKLYAAASKDGDDTIWGWLARWNELRLKMDDTSADPAELLKDAEKLAAERDNSELSSLVLMDAAIIAGERQKDAAKAVTYINQAEKLVKPATPMASQLSDIKHIYLVRAEKKTEKPE